MPETLPENPLPACPGTPNCVRTTRYFEVPAGELVAHARAALEAMRPAALRTAGDTLHAVFRVFVFKDDVAVQVAAHDTGSVLHIRSASRVGRRDLGVNRRRVARFFETLDV